jgi:hypothetical protein
VSEQEKAFSSVAPAPPVVVNDKDGLLREARGALTKLCAEVNGSMRAFEPEVRRAISNTNYQCMMLRVNEAHALLARIDAAIEGAQHEPVAWAIVDRKGRHKPLIYNDKPSEGMCEAWAATGYSVRPLVYGDAALAQGAGPGWRPIESAPRHERYEQPTLLLTTDGKYYEIACASKAYPGAWSRCNGWPGWMPTHWMPLPPPPADGGATTGEKP